MNASEFLTTILNPGRDWCLQIPGWSPHFDDRARLLLLAIAGQESGWSARIQSGNGPAHGFWQFERGGGVTGVLASPSTRTMALKACNAAVPGLTFTGDVWNLLATPPGDHLAVAFARLLLWSDPARLPAQGDVAEAWDVYYRNWRPGKPDQDRFTDRYDGAMKAMKENP